MGRRHLVCRQPPQPAPRFDQATGMNPADRRALMRNDLGGMIIHHTKGPLMSSAKIAITIDEELLTQLDRLVRDRRFPNRSRAVQEALRDKLERLERGRLARECAKLDPKFEQKLADEGLAEELDQWPEY